MGLTNMWSLEFVVASLLGILPMEFDLERDAVRDTEVKLHFPLTSVSSG